MKKITSLLMLLGTMTIASSQQLYLEGGKTISSFDYKNSQGNKLENLQSIGNTFMAMGYRDQFLIKNLNASIGVSHAGYGAIGSDDSVGNFMEWDVNYLGFNAGLDYELIRVKNAKFYVKGSVSTEFFLQGHQTLNNKVIDLKSNEDFDKTLFDFKAGFGLSHPISESLSFYAQYIQGKTFDSASGNEKLRIKNNNISFGLLIDIVKTTKEPITQQ
jgi:hypothetical protein